MRNFSLFSIRAAVFPLLLTLAVGCGSDEEVVTTDGEAGGGDASGGDGNSAPAAPVAPMDTGPSDPTADDMATTSPDSMMTTTDPAGGGVDYPGGGAGYPGGGPNDGTSTPAASKFPEDFAEWKPDDYRNAARTTDRRFKPAIEQLVEETPRDAKTAELLTELLPLVGKPANGNNGGSPGGYDLPGMSPGAGAGAGYPTTTPGSDPATTPNSDNADESIQPMPDGYPGGTPMPDGYPGGYGNGGYSGGGGGQSRGNPRELVHAIIDGLAKNNSDQAWQALTQVLAGQIKTVVNERQIADWVLAAALDSYGGVDHPTHALLEAAIRNPERLNKARGAELRGQTAALILATATSVMDRLMGVPLPKAPRRSPNGGNQPGGYPMPGGESYPMPGGAGDSPMPGGEGYPMPGEGAMAPGGGPNGGPGGPPVQLARRPLSDEAMRHAIQYLWRAETTSFVEGRTRSIQSLEDSFDTLALAGSLPTTGVRNATYDFLFSRWQDGANALLSRKLFQSVVRDPGMIVVLKQLPRLMKQGPITNQQSNTANPRVGKSQRQSIAKHSWMETSAYMVRAVTNRLQAATSNRDDTTLPKLPIRLHRNARVQGVYEMNWPADVSEFTSGVTPPGPLSLQYVKMEIPQEDAAKVFESYKKQLKRGKDYKFSWGGWIDSTTAGTEKGSRRSVDVLITQNTANRGANQNAGYSGAEGPEYPGGANGGGQQPSTGTFSVEILVVEIPDPKLSDATP